MQLKWIHLTPLNGATLRGEVGLIPAGPPWNMVGPFDFDGDGFGDFVVSSSYAGEFCNGVYHYEAAGNDSLELKWVYTFTISVALTMHIPVLQWGISMETEPRNLIISRHKPWYIWPKRISSV